MPSSGKPTSVSGALSRMRIAAFSLLIYATAFAQQENRIQDDTVREYFCPKGFFRAGNTCYFLSSKKATWKRAFFECNSIRNSTLAAPDTRWKDKFLRRNLRRRNPDMKYRWIGGMYNWRTQTWIWGTTGQEFKHQAFAKQKRITPSWTCVALDPVNHYKWAKRSCVSEFHYICEKPMRKRKKNSGRKRMKNDNKNQDRSENEVYGHNFIFDPSKMHYIPDKELRTEIIPH